MFDKENIMKTQPKLLSLAIAGLFVSGIAAAQTAPAEKKDQKKPVDIGTINITGEGDKAFKLVITVRAPSDHMQGQVDLGGRPLDARGRHDLSRRSAWSRNRRRSSARARPRDPT